MELKEREHLDGATEEFVTLTHPSLSLFEEGADVECDERPQHKITQFR